MKDTPSSWEKKADVKTTNNKKKNRKKSMHTQREKQKAQGEKKKQRIGTLAQKIK